MLGAPIRLGVDPLAWVVLPRIEIGPLAVSPHGIGIALGVLAGARLGVYVANRYGGPEEADIWNGLFWAMLGAIAGARIGYVLGHVSGVTDGGSDPLGVFKVWEGGISLLGGITGAVLASVPYMRRHGIPFWGAMDVVAPGLALGIGIGRFGDMVIGDHLGKPTTWPLGWRCLGEAGGRPPIDAAGYRAAVESGGAPSLGCFDVTLHQTALYDLLSTLLLLGLLLWLAGRRRRGGLLAIVFVIWYGTARMVTDFLRVDRRYLGLTGSQILALTVALVCLYLLARYRGAPLRWASGGYEPRSPAGEERPGPVAAA